MTTQDLFITPIYFLVLMLGAFFMRPLFTNRRTKKYFIPALLLKLIGAIALGVVYQFYYGGGDTFNYFTYGSKWIYQAFLDNPETGFKMLLAEGGIRPQDETFQYSSRIWFYSDPKAYLIIRLTALCDLFTFHTYSATSLFFAIFSFSGQWALFDVLVKKYPKIRVRNLLIAMLYVPSVVFWGSGILKDTVTLGAIGWMTWVLVRWIEFKKKGLLEIVMFLFSFYLMYTIKKYILICFIPTIFIWLFFKNIQKIKNAALKVIMVPILLFVFLIGGYGTLVQISSNDSKYSLDNVAERARITAYDIRYGWGATAGGQGGYDIGIPDGTFAGMLKLFPAAVNVSLFRPYLWEVKNPLMLLSAIESLVVAVLFFQFIRKKGWKYLASDPFLIFCLSFSVLFAFAVGVSTFNFGSLMRYKIPLMPFLLLVLFCGKPKSYIHD